eukprot:CAMPEP_0113628530 /NCGR_PEP_ID=MMETSP0017_2-20120614/14784_1 /TAXON_ID=2856 /ORGANISM="Cylindrotheca closterium" /LENGTH=1069 /DNA_ID=CAMNT_0000538841 /DNA_START=11 /DNA_END=3220 /DNA_ORIENTATION=+ /assembly_acc=CAM_ASM_000147
MDKNETTAPKIPPSSDFEANTSAEINMVKQEDEEAIQDPDSAGSPKDSKEGLQSSNATQEPTLFSDARGNLKVVNTIVRHPCKVFWFMIVLCLFLTFLLQALVFATAEGGSPFTEPGNEFDINDVRSIQYDSLRLARDVVSDARGELESSSDTKQVRSEVADVLYWVYESEAPEGVFGSAEAIEGMKDTFDIFLEDEEFSNWCTLDYRTALAKNATRDCMPPLSPLAMYYASTWDSEKVAVMIEQLKDPTKLNILNDLAGCLTLGLRCDQLTNATTQADVAWVTAITTNITSIASTWDMKGSLVENYTQVTELASYLLQVDIFKGLVDFGFDKGFDTDNPVSQFSRGILYFGGPLENQTSDSDADDSRKAIVFDRYLEEMDTEADADRFSFLNSYYFMGAIIGDVVLDIVVQDGLLAVFSFMFIFLWLRINTGSWFLAFVGFLEIFFSIPIAWVLFSVVFRIEYFGTMNSLAIFIVAAIGADDIFIFMDAYKQSKHRDPDNLVDMETRMSWVYRRTGTAMAITSATTCSAFLCTLITPLTSIQSFGIFSAIVIFIDYALVMTLFCTSVVIYHDRFEDRSKCGCCCPCGTISPSNTENARVKLEEAGIVGKLDGDRVSRFFRNQVAGFVEQPLSRMVLGVIFLAWLGVAIWQATQIEATKEAEQFLAADHPLQKSLTILNQEFPTASDDNGLKVYYAWGLREVDRDGVNLLLDPKYYGEPQFEESFDFNAQCQTELVSFCDKLKTDPAYKELIKQRNGVGEVYCFIEELAAFNVNGNLDDCDSVRRGDWKQQDWHVDASTLSAIMDDFLSQKTCFDPDGTDTVAARYMNEIGWDGSRLRYAAISTESAFLTPFSVESEDNTRREYDQFLTIANEANSIVSQYCSGNVVVTDLDEKFVFMNNQAIYETSAIQSSILGVCIAFTVLLISTRVFHLAFFASICICAVLVSVVGTMVMIGWELGSIESILIGITAGFSVDYVVHLAHAYEIADGDTYERVEEAFADLGISVFNGMLTSVAASIPLFFCQLQFFAKFGTFLCLTIAYSWIFANFGFMSILAGLKIPIKHNNCCSL